jgi:hypothetical protein
MRIKQEPEKLGMDNIWENEENDNKNVQIQISEGCVGTKRPIMEATTRE